MPWDVDLLAASLRRDSSDLSVYAGFLLNTLSAALPEQMVRVERKAGLFGRVRDGAPVLAVSIRCGDRRFALRRAGVGQPPVARIQHESGGIVLRTDEVDMDVWVRELAGALAAYAHRNAEAAAVLERLTRPGAT